MTMKFRPSIPRCADYRTQSKQGFGYKVKNPCDGTEKNYEAVICFDENYYSTDQDFLLGDLIVYPLIVETKWF